MFWILPQEAVLETVHEKSMVLVGGIEFPRADNWQQKVGWKIFAGPEKYLLEVLVATLNFASEVVLRLGVAH